MKWPETSRKSKFAGCRLGCAGRPQGFHFLVGWPGPTGHPRPPGVWQGWLARKTIGLCEASKPIPCAKRQAGAILGVLVVLVVLAAGSRARSGQVPAPSPGHRQDGGSPCGRNELRPSRSAVERRRVEDNAPYLHRLRPGGLGSLVVPAEAPQPRKSRK